MRASSRAPAQPLPLPARSSWIGPHRTGSGAGVALIAASRRGTPPGPPARAAATRRAGPSQGAGALHAVNKVQGSGFVPRVMLEVATTLGDLRGAECTLEQSWPPTLFASKALASCRALQWPFSGPSQAGHALSLACAEGSKGGTLTLLPASLLSPSDAAVGVRTRGSRPCPCRRRTPPRRGPDASESADADPKGASGSRSRLTWKPDLKSPYLYTMSYTYANPN